MLKACAGGGGRGIRLIHAEAETEDAYFAATSEAVSAFGDGSVYLEKYVFPARHVELQILADEAGHVVCLGERDCSVQRRNQKLLEETPSPAVGEAQRSKLIAAAAHAVKKIGYVGAGTLEFLLDSRGNLLVHGNEYPPAGGTRGDGDADRHRSGKMADSCRGRYSAEFYANGNPVDRLCG